MTERYEEKEIDILELVRILWNKRWTVIIVTAVFGVLGVLAALAMDRKYESTLVFVPQVNRSINSRISSIASLAGVDLEDSSKDGPISPIVYPYILDNVDFKRDLVHTRIHFNGYSEPIELLDWYTDPQYAKKSVLKSIMKYTIGLPGVIKGAITPKPEETMPSDSSSSITVPYLTSDEASVARGIMGNITLEVDKKGGNVTITAVMKEAVASTELADAVYDLLKKYISDFKVAKSRSNLEYLERQYADAKKDYESKQKALAYFKDRNRGSKTALAEVEMQRLNTEAELSRMLYTELAKNCLTARVKLTEDTVVFTDIVPASVPDKSANSRVTKVIIWTFLGFVISCLYVLISNALKKKDE